MATQETLRGAVSKLGGVRIEDVVCRVISDEELKVLEPYLEALGWPPLDPGLAKVMVAEAGEGESAMICGFQIIQFVTHAEPLWVHPSLRGTGIAEKLVETTVHYLENDCHIQRYVITAKPGSFAARLAESHGMRLMDGKHIYVKG